jgi:lipopolysaccharide export system protein LptA
MNPFPFPYSSLLACACLRVRCSLNGRPQKADECRVGCPAYDDAKQISVFTGKVVLTKGSIVIRGARSRCVRTTTATSSGVKAEPGKLRFFRKSVIPGRLDEFMEGEAEAHRIRRQGRYRALLRSGPMRRYLRLHPGNDEMSGSLIVYDNSTTASR